MAAKKEMLVEKVAINSVTPDPANTRRHPDRNLDAIAGSLKRFGQQKPIVVDSKGVVRAGNGTLLAARAIGWKEISIVRSDLPLSEMAAFSIADNRTAELAEWDEEVLLAALSDPEIGDVGFDESEIAKLDKLESTIPDSKELSTSLQILVECENEEQQKTLYERLIAEGLKCRVLTL